MVVIEPVVERQRVGGGLSPCDEAARPGVTSGSATLTPCN